MSDGPKRLGGKAFLNRDGHHGIAAVSWYAQGRDAGMTISDCTRSINLELGWYDRPGGFENALYKARTLRAAAESLEKAIAAAGRKAGYKVPTRKEQMG